MSGNRTVSLSFIEKLRSRNDSEKTRQISLSVGPAPWYFSTFPNLQTSSGSIYHWSFLGTEGNLAYKVGLVPGSGGGSLKFVASIYTRVFQLSQGNFGVWFQTEDNMFIHCFALDSLADFTFDSEILSFCKDDKNVPYYCDGTPICEMKIKSGIFPRKESINIPEPLKSMDELFLIGSNLSVNHDESAQTIYNLKIKSKVLRVLPQKWLTADKLDTGYQWITRVTRDPISHRIIGDGIRVGRFELSKDGMNLKRWITDYLGK